MIKRLNLGILVPVVILIAIGWVLILSASSYAQAALLGDQYYIVRQQTRFIAIGAVAMIVTYIIPYHFYNKGILVFLLALLAFVLMALVPFIGVEVGGAKRWLAITESFRFMPVDIAKVAIIFVLSFTLSHFNANKRKIINLMIHLLFPLLIFGLTAYQPDFSSAITIAGITYAILFVGFNGTPLIVGLGAAGLFGLTAIATIAPYRVKRITEFIDGMKDINLANDQIRYGVLAISSGGLFGVGPGRSVFNKRYIPEPHNDMIVTTLGEEYGLLGMLVVILLFFILIYNIFNLAIRVKDPFARHLSIGIGMIIFVQFMVNVGQTLAILPATGLTLPFISAGGTNLVIMMTLVGVLLSVSRVAEQS